MRLRNVASAVTMVAFLATSGLAAEAVDAKLRIERIALFKNGLGYFTATAALPEGATTVRFGQIPIPAFGSFWINYPEQVAVRNLVTSLEDSTEPLPARNITQLLAANVGRKVTITQLSEKAPVVEGTILAISPIVQPELPSPYVMDAVRPAGMSAREYYPYPQRPHEFVLIKTDDGIVTLNGGAIQRADFEGADISTSASVPVKKPTIRMELDKEAGGQNVSVSYLAHGITWMPSYLIDLSDPQNARFTGSATIINEVADMDGVRLDLVSGFPNVKFADISNPIAMKQSLADFLNALRKDREGGRSRGITSQMTLNNSFAGRIEETPGYPTAVLGNMVEDLFFYPVERVSLKRGETAYLPLFTAQVPYEHVYVWQVGESVDAGDRNRPQLRSDGRKTPQVVWHTCRLTNTMKMPWTSAPAEFVTEGRIAGQDVCYYTAPGTKANIRINQAVNVQAEQSEAELERTRAATTAYGREYDRIKVKGELRVRNLQDKAISLEVTRDLSGDVVETQPAAKDTTNTKGLAEVNTSHTLFWRVEMKPGEEKVMTYVYETLYRR